MVATINETADIQTMKPPFRFGAKRPQATKRQHDEDRPETPFETFLAALAMVFVVAGMVAVLVMLDSAYAEPETRCFDTAVGTTYCRTQSQW